MQYKSQPEKLEAEGQSNAESDGQSISAMQWEDRDGNERNSGAGHSKPWPLPVPGGEMERIKPADWEGSAVMNHDRKSKLCFTHLESKNIDINWLLGYFKL